MEEVIARYFETRDEFILEEDLIKNNRQLDKTVSSFILSYFEESTKYLVNREKVYIQNKNNPKTHNVLHLILSDDYILQLFDEYRLLTTYIRMHGRDEYVDQIESEFFIANDYISKMLKCNAFYVWQDYYSQLFRKLRRIEERIESYRDYVDDRHYLYFLTLTLDDNFYLSPRTINRENYTDIRTRVRKYVAAYSDYYVMNKDFGLQNTKRLHFHGVALLSKGELTSFKYHYSKKFGFCKLDPIDERSDLISKYINKLSQHAMKVNYGFNRENLIFSRNTSTKGIF